MPEVSSSRPEISRYWIKYFFCSPSQNHQINALASTYVRLVEAALVDYQIGILGAREYWETPDSLRLGAMQRSISHFEACISDMHRSINAFRRLRRHKTKEALPVSLAAIQASFASNAVADQIRLIRHEIHHVEELVMKGKISEGQSVTLIPDGPEMSAGDGTGESVKIIDRLAIGPRWVRFSDLATWLDEMAMVAATIAAFSPGRT